MDYLREIVSGKKNRYRDGGFNLDLTYVTDRVIAMSFPGAGLETMYRNNINDVSKLLDSRHGKNYMILNLSGRRYDYDKFGSRVIDFAWEDHHSPPIELLFQACRRMHEFIQMDINNVVAVHCLAGKGRTGTIIACYFLYSGRFDDTVQALQYYKKRRFKSGGGVTQPSQIRYVQYFGEILQGFLHKEVRIAPLIVQLEKLVLFGMPRISAGYFRPYVEIYAVRTKTLVFTTKGNSKPPKYTDDEDDKEKIIEIPFKANSLIATGDILIKVYHMSTLDSKLTFRFGFNTSFLDRDDQNKSILELPIALLDPDSTRDDDRFPINFKVQLHMTVVTPVAEPKTIPEKKALAQQMDEQPHINAIYSVLENYKHPSKTEGSIYLFRDAERDNVDEILKIQKNPQQKDNNDSEEEKANSGNSSSESDLSNSFSEEDQKSDGSQKYQSGDQNILEMDDKFSQ